MEMWWKVWSLRGSFLELNTASGSFARAVFFGGAKVNLKNIWQNGFIVFFINGWRDQMSNISLAITSRVIFHEQLKYTFFSFSFPFFPILSPLYPLFLPGPISSLPGPVSVPITMALKGCSNFQWHIGDELHFSVAYKEFTLFLWRNEHELTV